MELLALPAFADNYVWMLHDGHEALVVDPGEAAPVIQALRARGLELTGILVTHHHGDHVGGLTELQTLLRGSVFATGDEAIPGPHQGVHDGDTVHWNGLSFQVLSVPGHTAGHVAYYCEQPGDAAGTPLLFCGDTLFSGGCGRLFEGTPAQMLASLDRLATLPGDTRVCAAHEYTLSNLRFARHVDPDNTALAAYEAQCEARRAAGQPTLPSTIEIERHINPFLRAREPALAASLRDHGRLTAGADAVAVFTALREWKNVYR